MKALSAPRFAARVSLLLVCAMALAIAGSMAYAASAATPAAVAFSIPPRPVNPYPQPIRCEATYLLAPSERDVVTCPRVYDPGGTRGIVVLESGDERVDATLVRHLGTRVVVAVTNRSAEPIEGAVQVRIY